ncbi:MAG: ATP-binding cassette domain-containing protein [Planctomycetaceae bacterium]|nr:ATP-binding cassette domain-containing protein [Planctomycetaceae bacterium]
MNDADAIIRLQEVHKSFNGEPVLRGVNLAIEAGKTTVIIGPSGCGKSVLLKHMIALIRPDRGEVFFRNRPIGGLCERQMVDVRRRFGFLFQGGALFDSMTVQENIVFPLAENHVSDPERQKARCREVLSLVGLDGTQQKYPEELSGGQKKRVALARAIALGPEVILYDEPTTGLDPIRADLINELIINLQKALQTTAVVVTHDMTSACKIADRIVMLYGGVFIADTTPAGLATIDNETVLRFVQGRASAEELEQIRAGRLARQPFGAPAIP